MAALETDLEPIVIPGRIELLDIQAGDMCRSRTDAELFDEFTDQSPLSLDLDLDRTIRSVLGIATEIQLMGQIPCKIAVPDHLDDPPYDDAIPD